jgi:c-di-GMP-related signal transduction protein
VTEKQRTQHDKTTEYLMMTFSSLHHHLAHDHEYCQTALPLDEEMKQDLMTFGE